MKADGLAAHAFMTSAIASASALLSWMLLDIINDRKTTLVGASTGLVIGLVAITPGAGFVPIWSSFIIGALVSPICYYGVILIKKKLKIDERVKLFYSNLPNIIADLESYMSELENLCSTDLYYFVINIIEKWFSDIKVMI